MTENRHDVAEIAAIHAEVKARFGQLVKAARGIVPAAACLDISPQRVSVLQLNTHPDDVPTWAQVILLERFVGRPVVTGGLAEAVTGGATAADPLKEAVDVIVTGARAVELERQGADLKLCEAAANQLEQETAEYVQTVRARRLSLAPGAAKAS